MEPPPAVSSAASSQSQAEPPKTLATTLGRVLSGRLFTPRGSSPNSSPQRPRVNTGSEIVQPVTPRVITHLRSASSPSICEPSVEKRVATCDMAAIINSKFDTLNVETVLMMTPQERNQLKLELASGQSEFIKEWQRRLQEIQAKAKDRQLLLFIETKHPTVCGALQLAAETVIKPEMLFTLIHQAILPIKEQIHPAKKVLAFLDFTIAWLENNRARTHFVTVQDLLEKIAKVAGEHSSMKVKSLAEIIHRKVTTAPEAAPEVPLLRDVTIDFFVGVLNQVRLVQNVDDLAEKTANDLLLSQWGLFKALRPGDLVDCKRREKPAPLAAYMKHFDTIFFYFLEQLLLEPLVENRVKLVNFFLNILERSFEKKDFSSAFSLLAIFSSREFGSLKATKERLSADFRQKIDAYNTFFNGQGNLRKKYLELQGTFFIPYLGTFQKELTIALENIPELTKESGEEEYNFYKPMLVKEECDICFSAKKLPYPYELSFFSNLIFHHLQIHKAMPERSLSELADSLESMDMNGSS